MTDSIVSGLSASRNERLKPSADAMLAELEAMDAPQVTPQAQPKPTPSAPVQSSPGFIEGVGNSFQNALVAPFAEGSKAAIGGLRDGAVNTWKAIDDAAVWLNNNGLDLRIANRTGKTDMKAGTAPGFRGDLLPKVGENKTVAGNIGRSIFQFLPEFIVANKALATTRLFGAATKVATAGRAAAAGAVADATAFDPHEKRVSNMVMELSDGHPIVGATVFNYLAADPTDSNGEGRFKNALEGLGLGLATEGLFKAVKATKHYFNAKGENAAEAVQNMAKVEPTLDAPAQAVTTESPDLAKQIDEINGIKPKETPEAVPLEQTPKVADEAIQEPAGVTLEGDAATVDAIQQVLPEEFKVSDTPIEEAAMKAEPPKADPMATVLADPKYASIAPGTRKPIPSIPSAKVTQIIEASKNGTLKDLADGLDHSDFNFDRIDSAEDIQELMDATSKVFEKETSQATGGTQSFEQIQELADTLGTSTEDLKTLYGDTGNLAARVTANRILLAASAKKTSEMAANAATGDNIAMLAFRKQVILHSSIQSQMKGVQSEIARALGAMRIEAKAGNLVLNEVDDLLANLGGREVNLKFARKMAEQTDPAKIAAMTRMGAMARTQDAVYEMWVNNILSGPTTHVVNAMGNSLVALLTVAERGTASAVGKIFRGGAADRVQLGEVQAQLFGMVEGLKDVFSITGDGLRAMRQATGEAVTGNFGKAGETLRSAQDEFGGVYTSFANDTPILDNALYGTKEFDLQAPAISAEGMDLDGWAGNVADVLGAIIRTPGRVLTTTDEVFKTIHYRGELKAQAYRQAKGEGLEGEDFIQRVGELVADRSTPLGAGDELSARALEAARRGTFTNTLGDGGKALQTLVSKVPGARYVFPFVRTPANIMNYTWERTPLLNVLNNRMKEDFMAGGVRRDTAVAKTAIGGAFYIMAAQLAAEGKITGHLEKKSGAEKMAGQQAYSVKIGDTYYAYNRLDPIGMIFGLAADFQNITGNVDDAKRNDISAAMITAISSNLLSKSYLSTASEIFQIIGNVEQTERSTQFDRFIDRQAASFIPFSSAVRTVRRDDDKVVREVWDLMDTLKNSVPGYSKDLYPHRNVFGDPVVYGGGLGPDIASPIYTSKESDNPAANEIARLNIDLQLPAKTIASGKGTQSLDLTHEQYDRYVALAGNEAKVFHGKGFKDYLTEYVNTPKYQDATDDGDEYTGGKRLQIETLYASAKKVALWQMLDEFPDLKERYMQNVKNRGNALKGAPIIPILTEAQ